MIDALSILAAADPHAAGEAISLPQQFGIDLPYLIAQIVSFSIVAYLLYRFAFKPVLATLDERQTKIEDGLRFADDMKVQLAESEVKQAAILKEASLEAQKIIHESRDTGKEMIERQTQEAAERAEQMIAKAQQTIELEHKKMLADVRDEISRLVVLTTSRVLSRELPDAEKARYVAAATQELDRN